MQLLEIVRAPQTGDEALARAYDIAAAHRQNAGARCRYAGLHRQSRRPAVLSSGAARAGTRRRLRRRARCARARGRLSHGSLRVDGFNRARRQSRDDGIDLRPHRAERFAPVELQREMVARGLLGRKSGAGFYTTTTGSAERFDATVLPPDGEPDDGRAHRYCGIRRTLPTSSPSCSNAGTPTSCASKTTSCSTTSRRA